MKMIETIQTYRSGYQNYLDALNSVLAYYDKDIDVKDVVEIVGNDGMFEFHFSEMWHDEASIFSRKEDIPGLICEHLGYDYEWFLNQNFNSTWKKIKESIDEGHPVITQSLGSEISRFNGEWMIIYGYSEEAEEPIIMLNGSGENCICTTFPERNESNGEILWGDHFPFQTITVDFHADKPLFIVRDKIRNKVVMNEIEIAILNLRRIVEYAYKEYVGGKYKLWAGIKGMNKWQETLRNLDDQQAEQLVEDPCKFIVHYNAQVPVFLVNSRKNTSFYLFKIASLFEKPVMSKLWQAAELFSHVSEHSLELLELLYLKKKSWEDEKFEAEIERGAERLRDSDYRIKAANRIGNIIKAEQHAVKNIKDAVELIDK